MSRMHFVNYRVCTKAFKETDDDFWISLFFIWVCLLPEETKKGRNKLFKNNTKKITISFTGGELSCSYSWIITVSLQQMEKQSQGWVGAGGVEEGMIGHTSKDVYVHLEWSDSRGLPRPYCKCNGEEGKTY